MAGPSEVIKFQLASRHYRELLSNQRFWVSLSSQTSLLTKLRYVKLMVERRSRGKLYLTECRATGKLFTVRFAWLDTMNAGVDDGVPASVLRELNYLKFLGNEPVQNLVSAELKNRFVVIQCEYV